MRPAQDSRIDTGSDTLRTGAFITRGRVYLWSEPLETQGFVQRLSPERLGPSRFRELSEFAGDLGKGISTFELLFELRLGELHFHLDRAERDLTRDRGGHNRVVESRQAARPTARWPRVPRPVPSGARDHARPSRA